MAATFMALDTLAAVKRLRAARFDEDQAEAVTELLREREGALQDDLATKADLALTREALRTEMTELRAELRGEMAELRTMLRGEIAASEQRLRAAIADSRAELLKWFAGVMIAQGLGIVVATVTLTKLLSGTAGP
jgi:uncharacterized protein YlxW (UPF0749 family)